MNRPNFPLFRVRKETHKFNGDKEKSAWIVESVLGFEADYDFRETMRKIFGRKEKALRGCVFFCESDAIAQCNDLNSNPERFEKQLAQLEQVIEKSKNFSIQFSPARKEQQ